jgi:hypothetical protein
MLSFSLLVGESDLAGGTQIFYVSEEGGLIGHYVSLNKNDSMEKRIKSLMTQLLENEGEFLTTIPLGTELLEIKIDNSYLELTFSNDIMEYGGTLTEWCMINQILATLFSVNDIEKVSLYIKDEGNLFVEGTVINSYTREEWEKREEIIWLEAMEGSTMK